MRRAFLIVPLLIAACVTPAPVVTPAPAPSPQAVAATPPPCNPGHTILNATAWVQTSAEYEANALQTYSAARRMLDAALADRSWSAVAGAAPADAPVAIILDADETVLDNMEFEVRMIGEGKTYTREAWKKWVNESRAKAIPGARDFLVYAKSRGVTPFYVTNRDDDEEAGTRRNLEALGFPMSTSEDVVLTRGERPEWKTSDKSGRREFVASRYRVVMLFGDDLNDFVNAAGKTREERTALVRSHAADLGQKWFILPNPIYGSWERALLGDTTGLSDCRQLQKKLDLISGSTARASLDSGTVAAPRMITDADEDLRAIIVRTYQEIDAKGELKIAAGSELSDQARRIASTVRPIVTLSQVPQTATVSFPQGYARLDRVDLEGNEASVQVWFGPIPKVKPGEASLNCGTGRTFEFERQADGTWKLASMGVMMC